MGGQIVGSFDEPWLHSGLGIVGGGGGGSALPPSSSVTVVQTPATQALLAQLLSTTHIAPSMHRGVEEPPQSTSLSSASLRPSVALGGVQGPALSTHAGGSGVVTPSL
jgi:hypothetical protein